MNTYWVIADNGLVLGLAPVRVCNKRIQSYGIPNYPCLIIIQPYRCCCKSEILLRSLKL